jgi:hypothetical protein
MKVQLPPVPVHCLIIPVHYIRQWTWNGIIRISWPKRNPAMNCMKLMLILLALLSFGRAIANPVSAVLGDHDTPPARIGHVNRYVIRADVPQPEFHGSTGHTVEVRGMLHVSDDRMHDVTLVVEVEDGHLLHASLKPNGRFTIALPADVRARLFFQKPEHVEKEIWVDTRNALAGKRGMRRKVSFDVVLQNVSDEPLVAGDGPEGCVRFLAGTGTLRVHYYEGSMVGQITEQRRTSRRGDR